MPWRVAAWAAFVILALILAWALTRINGLAFKKLRKRRDGIHIVFLERIISLVLVVGFILFAVSLLGGFQTVWQTVIGGTALLSAVLAFIAQDVIKDVLAGIMISSHKPFEIGDRISLEDGTNGIVETMTMRHVVVIGVDTPRIVIPNSRINSMQLINYSYKRNDRSAAFDFPIGYGSDVALAKRVIRQAVEESPVSLPGRTDENGQPCYGPVYFLLLADSALMMRTTVYFDRQTPAEVVLDDVNTRVRQALIDNGIEIPYNYVNVVSVSEKNGGDK